MLTDDYQDMRSARLGGTARPTVTTDGDVTVVRFPRRLPLDDLPSALRALAGSGEITQVERWHEVGDERCAATWTTESNLPGKVTGTFEVVPDGDGARYTVVATAEVKVPLVGGRLGREVEGHVAALIEAEMDLAAEFLAGDA
jgi:hypothetical protein